MRWSSASVLTCCEVVCLAVAACSGNPAPVASNDASPFNDAAGSNDADDAPGFNDAGVDETPTDDAGGATDQMPAETKDGECPRIEHARPMFVSCSEPRVSVSFDATGTVLQWGTGYQGCLSFLESPDYMAVAPPSASHLLRVRTAAGVEQAFGVLIQGVSPAINVGDTVRVVYETAGGGFSPVIDRLEITGAAGLILYVGAGGLPKQMTPPAGVSFELGRPLCSAGGCGPWGRFDLSVNVEGTAASLAPGASARVGRYFVAVGQSEQQTGNSSMCADWFVSRTTVAITP